MFVLDDVGHIEVHDAHAAEVRVAFIRPEHHFGHGKAGEVLRDTAAHIAKKVIPRLAIVPLADFGKVVAALRRRIVALVHTHVGDILFDPRVVEDDVLAVHASRISCFAGKHVSGHIVPLDTIRRRSNVTLLRVGQLVSFFGRGAGVLEHHRHAVDIADGVVRFGLRPFLDTTPLGTVLAQRVETPERAVHRHDVAVTPEHLHALAHEALLIRFHRRANDDADVLFLLQESLVDKNLIAICDIEDGAVVVTSWSRIR